ncbi:MAG TPA: RHS repeat-associated core domain-containing protein, partial [Saprospiraceae bacterium]|nr:RHS repeat-associated core domain-containing protein [Saprospiraceae bacterium]
EIIEEMHYYPFGMMMEGSWMGETGQYGYNGIEYENFLDLEMNLATYRGLDPALGRWMQVDPKAEAAFSHSPYNSMFNNPVSMSDPEGDLPFLAMGIAAVLHTVTHLATNNFSFNNWNWGAFAGSIVAGGVGGGLSPALTKAGIGGFAGGALTGGASGFAQNLTSGLINGNLTLGGLATNTFMGAGVGGLVQGISSAIDGRRFGDGAKVEYTTLGTDPDLPHVMQKGTHNCACATAEMTMKSNGVDHTQQDVRSSFGGDPNQHPLPDHGVHNYIKIKGNLNGDFYGTQNIDQYISKADYINQSLRDGKSINLSISGSPGHSVSVQGAYFKTITKVNGLSSSNLTFRIFDPARSRPYYMNNSFLTKNVSNVFSYWPK